MNFFSKRHVTVTVPASMVLLAIVFIWASAQHYSDWTPPVNAESIPGASILLNTPFNDGCPIEAPDGLSLFIASNRPGGLGGQDIWVATREITDAAWGDPIHLPAPVNSDKDDFCPSPVRGHGLFFVSRRYIPGVSCGTATSDDTDIYFTRYSVKKGHVQWDDPETWTEPEHLECVVVNSAFDEWSPSYFEGEDGLAYLYFASTRPGGPGATNDADIYFSVNFGPSQIVASLNTEFDDHRPNVRKDGLEIVFDSTRDGFVGTTRNPDIWIATRESIYDDWETPVHLPEPVNSPSTESRASLSWDGLAMYFGSNRVGSEEPIPPVTIRQADVYVTTRTKLKGYEVME